MFLQILFSSLWYGASPISQLLFPVIPGKGEISLSPSSSSLWYGGVPLSPSSSSLWHREVLSSSSFSPGNDTFEKHVGSHWEKCYAAT